MEMSYKITIGAQLESLNHIQALYLSSQFSDLTFQIDDSLIPAHKAIVGNKSPYFQDLIERSGGDVIRIDNVCLDLFKELLKYIYTGQFYMDIPDLALFFEIVSLANLYLLSDLLVSIAESVYDFLTLDSVLEVLNFADLHKIEVLNEPCYMLLEHHSHRFMDQLEYTTISQKNIAALLQRDTFYLPETKIFEIAYNWRAVNEDPGNLVLSCVRFNNMTINDIKTTVMPKNCVPEDELISLMSTIQNQRGQLKKRKFRPKLLRNTNLNHPDHNARYITGTCVNDSVVFSKILDTSGIVLELGDLYMIDNIVMLFPWDERKPTIYSYYLQVSIDNQQWDTIIDYRKYDCTRKQKLYFPIVPARYIKAVGTYSSLQDQIFKILSMEVFLQTDKIVKTVEDIGYVNPQQSIANMGVHIIHGFHSSEYDELWCSQAKPTPELSTPNGDKSGLVLMQFAQPYWMSKFSFTTRSPCTFCILTSIDAKNWKIAAERGDKSSPQSRFNLVFPERAVVYIKVEVYTNYQKACLKNFRFPA